MDDALGETYARFWAQQQAVTELRSRTVQQALADGVPPKQVWAAVWRQLQLPEEDR